MNVAGGGGGGVSPLALRLARRFRGQPQRQAMPMGARLRQLVGGGFEGPLPGPDRQPGGGPTWVGGGRDRVIEGQPPDFLGGTTPAGGPDAQWQPPYKSLADLGPSGDLGNYPTQFDLPPDPNAPLQAEPDQFGSGWGAARLGVQHQNPGQGVHPIGSLRDALLNRLQRRVNPLPGGGRIGPPQLLRARHSQPRQPILPQRRAVQRRPY